MKDVISKLNELDGKYKIGEVIIDHFYDKDSCGADDIGNHVSEIIMNCKNEREFGIANEMIVAITGNSIESILNEIDAKDKDGFMWENF